MLRRTLIMFAPPTLVQARPLSPGCTPQHRRYGIRTPKILFNAFRQYRASRQVVVGLAWATIRTRRPLAGLVALNIAFVPLLFFDVDRYF